MAGDPASGSGSGGGGQGARSADHEAQAECLRRALRSLGETLSDIVEAVERRQGERCPYRSARDECTFRGGCRNKIRVPGAAPRCGGDQQIQWTSKEETP